MRGSRSASWCIRRMRRRMCAPSRLQPSKAEAKLIELDDLDRKATDAFPGHMVRKDLVCRFRGQFPVPTYVVEFMLGRYCASTDAAEIEEGVEMVREQLTARTVRAGEEELFKARARERGSVRMIDIITARLDARTDSYLATLPGLRLHDVRIGDRLVKDHERMLTGGFYTEIDLGYDATIAQEKGGRPFEVLSLREIQLSTHDILDKIAEGRRALTTVEWKDLLLRSVGLEPAALSPRARDVSMLRMIPFVERNYNMVELGPRGTGKSHLFQQVSPYAHLVSGGKATVARMFVNMANGQRGLVCQYDVVCFDEVSGVSFDQRDGVNIMKGYMESGEFSRGRESIRADGSIVLVENFEIDVQHQQRIGHLFGALPPEMRNDTAFMDRIHSYLPGWDIPKVSRSLFTDHFGLVSDVLAETFSRLRSQARSGVLHGRVHLGGALSGRDANAVGKTVSGLLKLLYPDASQTVPDEDLEWAVRLALECRRRVKEQQKRIGSAEFRNTQFSYSMGLDGIEQFVSTPELQSEGSIGGMELDALDRIAADAFTGLVVRKDLVRQFRGQFPIPTYVVEFMLGRYCATTDEQEISEGMELVRTQLSSRTVRAGEEGVKFRARDAGAVRIIDIITAWLKARSDSYLATLPCEYTWNKAPVFG